jgi:ribonucleoside-diphosphate reductase alpha chain
MGRPMAAAATRSSAATAPWWAFEPNKIAVALMKAFLAVHGTQGAASASVRETVERPDRVGGARAAALAPGRRHLPHRGRAGPRRTGPDARRPPRSGARLCAVPRAPHAGARARAGGRPRQTGRAARHRPVASGCRWTWRRCVRWSSRPARAWADVKAEPILAETRRNLYDGVPIDEVYKAAILAARTLIEKGAGLHPRHRAAAAAHHPPRDPGWRSDPGADGRALRRVLPAVHQEGRGPNCWTKAAQFDLARLGAALEPARPAVRLPGPADAVRPLLPAHRRAAHRDAAGLLHARGHGPGAERDRPRSARHRVLQRAVELRLHEQHAHAVQQRHAALAAAAAT